MFNPFRYLPFGRRRIREADKEAEIVIPLTETTQIDPESIRLYKWLQDNSVELMRDTDTKMVVKTGTDFETNQPTLELIPKIPRPPKRESRYVENDAVRIVSPVSNGHENRNGVYFFRTRSEWIEALYNDGELPISTHSHYGKGDGGLRGMNLANKIAGSIKQYLRDNGVEHPFVDVIPGQIRHSRIFMDQRTYDAFRKVVETEIYQVVK